MLAADVILNHLHLQCTGRTQIRLEDILETLSSTDVDLQGISSPLDEMLVRAYGGVGSGEQFIRETRPWG